MKRRETILSSGTWKKGFKHNSFRNQSKSFQYNNNVVKNKTQSNFPMQKKNQFSRSTGRKIDGAVSGPLKWWGCGEKHNLRVCSHRTEIVKILHNIEQATTLFDMARSTIFCTALDNRQEEQHSSVT